MIYGIIPARAGSKGIPNKNIKELQGKPLLLHSIITSLSSRCIDRTFLTTDSEVYGDMIRMQWNILNKEAEVIIRPEYLSNDSAGDIDYLLHFVYTHYITPDDYIVLLRPTTPVRDIVIIDDCIKNFMQEVDKYDSLRSMHKLSEPPAKMMRIDNGMAVPYINGMTLEETNQPRQKFEDCYHPNGYIDIIKCKTLIEKKQVYGDRIYPFITDPVIEVDCENDFRMLEVMYG